ncbi:MAG: HEPN domain-containing protein [Phreatobacter sp.]|uniref:HEPN domain-containing protein n=1 Tax=Phreatobacter sp. TaxID=1966341 RepID=UPI0027366F43|nr:HEPN domain-containing protein [Phreatobacter sp.]MDP2803790.1 HEPN domain-containing protein [Phreatobacter sp.]
MARQTRKQDKFYIVSPFGVALETLPGGTHQISSGLTFSPLANEYRISIIDYLDEKKEEALSQRVRSRPAFLIDTAANEIGRTAATEDERIDAFLQVHRFALETICNLKCPLAVFGSDGSSVIRHHIETTDLWRMADTGANLHNDDWDKHATFLRFLYESVPVAPLSLLSITRLSKAFREGPTPDGIIDIAICLECLITASSEIKFQFALYHSLIGSDDITSRDHDFRRLQKLYDVRSKTVHGGQVTKGDKKKLAELVGDWDNLIALARKNITYYLLFCRSQGPADWPDHLRALALGEARIQPEASRD